MGYSETVVDDFNDNSFSTAVWNTPNGTANITESGEELHMKTSTTATQVVSKAAYNLATSIVAVKWRTPTGTATSSCVFYLNANDGSNQVNIALSPSNNGRDFSNGGKATVTNKVITGSGTAIPDGTWIGLGMLGNDNVCHAYSSPDGITWSEWGRFTVGGTLNKTSVNIKITASYSTSSESPTWTAVLDEIGVWTRSFRQTVVDTFDGSSLDRSIWTPYSTDDLPYISESAGQLAMECVTDYPQITANTNVDLSSSIVAVQLYQSGNPTASTQLIFGVADDTDSSGNGAQILITSNSVDWTFQAVGSATISSDQYSQGNDLGTAWANGDWIGLGYVGSDNVLSVFKSADGVTWTEIGCVTIGGSFNKTAAGLFICVGYYSTTESPTFGIKLDNYSVFSLLPLSTGTVKVRVGGSWVTAVPKVRVGGSWVPATVKARVGGAWSATN